jgi:carboxypeptidase C (cathepsin A)
MRFLLAASAIALLAAPAFAQSAGDKPKSLDAIHSEALIEQAKSGYADAPVEERIVQTRHSVAVAGRTLPYTATAGTLTIRDVVGKPRASIFYTAYTLDSARGGNRPVTFFYNGGPGSPTLWLHMGSFGPMRLVTGSPEFIRPAPFAFGPNPDTLLGATDMVFIDAPGAGLSRPLGDAKPGDFYGVDQDADAFARAVLRYVTKFGRWNSPKFLFGESYGTTRSGALAYQLQDRGLALNGVILLSSIMNYGSRQPGLDQVYLNYLPSYATTAWYHHKMANPPATVAEAAAERAPLPSAPMQPHSPRAKTSARRKKIPSRRR